MNEKKKDLSPRIKFRDQSAEQRLKETVFLVEATNFEQQVLWEQYAYQSPSRRQWVKDNIDWQQANPGYGVHIGFIANRPIMLSLSWVYLNGWPVCFWEIVSELADFKLAENWFDEHFTATYDNGHRRARTDAANFAHCIHAIIALNEE